MKKISFAEITSLYIAVIMGAGFEQSGAIAGFLIGLGCNVAVI